MNAVEVRPTQWGFEARRAGAKVVTAWEPHAFVVHARGARNGFGPLEERLILAHLSWSLGIRPTPTGPELFYDHQRGNWCARGMDPETASTITRELRRIRETITPRVLGVHRAVFREVGYSTPLIMEAEFYRPSHLAEDVLRYRAAAIAAALPDEFVAGRVKHPRCSNPRAISEWVSLMVEWPSLFSPTGKVGGPLRRTLAILPKQISARLAWISTRGESANSFVE